MRLIFFAEETCASIAPPRKLSNGANHLANLRVGELGSTSTREPALKDDIPLKLAVLTNHQKIARLLLEAGGHIDGGDHFYDTPLHFAASGGDEEMVKLLLEHRANPQVQNNDLQTPVMLAAAGGHLQALQALSSGGADLRLLDISGSHVLHYAVSSRGIECFVYLIAVMNGCDFAQRNLFGESVLEAAFRVGEHNMQILILNTALSPRVYYPGENNILTAAVRNSRMTTGSLRMLLRRVPQELLPTLLRHRARFGGTPLYAASTLACMSVQNAIIGLLLDGGAELEIEGGEYGSPLMGACAAGRLQAVKLLSQKGAKILYYNEQGQSVSAFRAAKHFPNIHRWLLVGRYTEGPRLLTDGGVE